MRYIGSIAWVQIQQAPLKRGDGNRRIYDPTPIRRVARLQLAASGVLGVTDDDDVIMDVHHKDHPQSRNRKGANGISLGFLQNYDRMQSRFGEHILTGCGGENIVVQAADDFVMDTLGSELLIKTEHGGQTVHLRDLMVAAPCEPFSRYVASRPLDKHELRDMLEFLSDGTRGFYATLAPGTREPFIKPGDQLYMP